MAMNVFKKTFKGTRINLKINGYWVFKAFKINIPKKCGIKKHLQTNIG
jgi:hypothetical protein